MKLKRNKMERNKKTIVTPMINIIVLFILFLSRQATAQTNSENAKINLLKTEIIKMDSLLFDGLLEIAKTRFASAVTT